MKKTILTMIACLCVTGILAFASLVRTGIAPYYGNVLDLSVFEWLILVWVPLSALLFSQPNQPQRWWLYYATVSFIILWPSLWLAVNAAIPGGHLWYADVSFLWLCPLLAYFLISTFAAVASGMSRRRDKLLGSQLLRTVVALRVVSSVILAGILVYVCITIRSDLATARWSRGMTQTVGNGRNLFTLLFAEDMESLSRAGNSVFPTVNDGYRTSTEYFQRMMDSGVMPIAASYFSAPGVGPTSGETLTPDGNAWCVNCNLTEDSPYNTPALFTRNLHFSNRNGRAIAFLTDDDPYGKLGAVSVALGGAARKIRTPEDLSLITDGLQFRDVEHILRP